MKELEELTLEDIATRDEQKIKALEIMKKLDIFEPYVNGFKEEDEVCFFENYAGFWAWQEPEIIEKIKKIEKEHNCLVYAVTHEYTNIGECYDFLFVSQYKEEWDSMIEKMMPNKFYAYAYVWNKNYEDCSEIGDVIIHSFGGGIRRIG